MESRETIINKERLMEHPHVQRLVNAVSLAENGFFLLEVSSSKDAQQILAIVQDEVPKQTRLPIDIVSYRPRTDPNYRVDTINMEKISGPFKQWVQDIQIPQENDAGNKRLFVIDGSEIDEKYRTILVDHFAYMNGLRDSITGNERGPVLVIIPARLEIEKDIGGYGDLMSCCSERFHIKE